MDEAGFFHKIPRIDDSRLTELFTREVLADLVRKELLNPEWAERLRTFRHTGFSVHSRVRAKTKTEAERVGKYMIRALLSLERLSFSEKEGQLCYRYGKEAGEVERMDYLGFIARVVSHIPDKGQVTVRYYGLYANSHHFFPHRLRRGRQDYRPPLHPSSIIVVFYTSSRWLEGTIKAKNAAAAGRPEKPSSYIFEEDDTITEFKTSAQIMDPKEVDTHLQLTIYSYAFEALTHRRPKLLRVIDFVKTKKPKLIPLETKRTKADYQRSFFLSGQVLKGIRSQVFFPRSGFWCKDCEYGEYCRSWGGSE